MKISTGTSREQLAAIVVEKLQQHNIRAVLVGGAVVSIYTNNKYESRDLDFISLADHQRIQTAMSELGFVTKGKDFIHPDTAFTVEFPKGPVGIGNDEPVAPEGSMTVEGVVVKMLSPTQAIMDRLVSFFEFNDRQCLDQAIWIAQEHPVNLPQIRDWASREANGHKLQVFLNRIKIKHE